MSLIKVKSRGTDNVTGGGSKNVIINGAMQVAQRGTTITSITSSGYNTVDRWRVSLGTAGTWTMTQAAVTDLPGFRSSLKMDCTTADASLAAGDDLAIQQRMSGRNLQQFKKGTSSAEEWTLSFYVKSTTTGTYICELFDNDNNRHVNKSYTISTANTWEFKTITFPADTTGTLNNNSNHNFRVTWYLAAGSNFTSGTLQTTWGGVTNANKAVGQVNLAASTSNDWQLTGVQLQPGNSATDFEHRSYAHELQDCSEYYQQFNGNNYTVFLNGGIDSVGGSTYVMGPLRTEMRAIPTVTFSNCYLYSQPGTTVNYTGTVDNRCNVSIATLGFTGIDNDVGQGHAIRFESNNNNGVIKYDAEL
jgi:hypothetical protein|tara:strand:- start:195 stop:1277 length:1083 start_codon:yes stop_codon:yes gene_type:complete